MIALFPAEWFALGVMAGIIVSLSGWGAVVFWVDEIREHRRPASDVTADADVAVCEDCKVVLHEGNTADTCGVHHLCLDCNADSNASCKPCRSERFHAGADQAYDWSREGWLQ